MLKKPQNLVNQNFVGEQQHDIEELDDTVVNVDEDIDDIGHDSESFDNEGFESDDNENRDDINLANEESSQHPLDIFDPRNWKTLDLKWRDLLVEKGPVRDLLTGKGPKDQSNRRFNSTFYTRYLPNGEKHHRKWLVYSNKLDKLFCFCCKLFKTGPQHSQLVHEGYNDWGHINRLKDHETSLEHVNCMSTWIDFHNKLKKNKTIDKVIQEQIKKEKEHWRSLLRRLISIVKYLAKQSLAFRGTNEKVYQQSNGNFMGQVEMIAEWYTLMKEHLRRREHNEIHYHYLIHKIQNELILLLATKIRGAILYKN